MDDAMKEVEILLVEDNPTDAELAIRALKKSNLANKLVWVKDGAEALDFIFATGAYSARQMTNGPKVVLLDLRLPKVDGMEVLRRIKSDERTRTIPVVVLTSSKEDRDVVGKLPDSASTATSASRSSSMSSPRRCPSWDSTGCW